MFFIALVSIGDTRPGLVPPGLRTVGGITLVDRQVRQALKAGAAEIWLIAPELPEDLERRFAAEDRVRRVTSAAEFATQFADRTLPVLMFQSGVLVDERLVDAMTADMRAPLLLTTVTVRAGAERLDSQHLWMGLARLPAPLVTRVSATLGDWDLESTLVRTAVEAGADRLESEKLDTYAAPLRRRLPFVWARPTDDTADMAATDILLDAAQKHCLDWPARFIHAPVEKAATRLLLPTAVTPNLVTLITAVVGAVGIAAFAMGYLWAGLVALLLVGPLDGIDGKLARVRHEFSRWGDLEHVVDKIVEYGSWIALGFWFWGAGHGLAAGLAAGGIVIFSLAEALNGEFFRRYTGQQLDDWGQFERRFRLIGGRRNTYVWTLLPFAVAGLWFEGFLWILAYSLFTFCIAHWRFMAALMQFGRSADERVRANFAQTSYDFLPRAGMGAK